MNSTWLLSEADEAVGATADAQVVDHALLKLGELMAAVETRPWLLAVGLHQPHLPFVAPQRSYAPYSDTASVALARHGYCPWGLPTKAFSTVEIDRFLDVPRWFAGENARCNESMDDASARRLRRGYYASVTYVDEQIGRLLQGLRDSSGGAAWNTTVTCIWSDHGFELGEHGSWSKHTLWHVTTRIPLLLRVPGTTPAAGAISEGLVEALDIMPTLWHAATGRTLDTCPGERPWEPRNCTEGVSFLPLAAEPHSASGWKRLVLAQQLRKQSGTMGYSMTTHDGVRFTAWVETADETANLTWGDQGLAWRLREESGAPAWELYDHRVDPGETRNLACSVCGWVRPAGVPPPDELFETLKLAVRGGRPPDGWPFFGSPPPSFPHSPPLAPSTTLAPCLPQTSPPSGAQTSSTLRPPTSPPQPPSSPPQSPSSPPPSQDGTSAFVIVGGVLIGVPLLGVSLVLMSCRLRRWAGGETKRPRESARV